MKNKVDKIRIIFILIMSIFLFLWIVFIINPNNIASKVPIISTFIHKDMARFIDDAEYELRSVRRYMEYRRENLKEGIYSNDKVYMDNLIQYQKDIEEMIVFISLKNPPKELKDYKKLIIKYLNVSNSIISTTISASIVDDEEDKSLFLSQLNKLIDKYNRLTKEMNEELISIFENKGIEYKIHNDRISYWWR